MSNEKEAPERIYLQWSLDAQVETTWCQDRINDDDIEYIKRETFDSLKVNEQRCYTLRIKDQKRYNALQDENEDLKTEVERLKESGLKATELIAHLKDQVGELNDVEQKEFDELIQAFGYKGDY